MSGMFGVPAAIAEARGAELTWRENMMIAGSQALLLALWRDHAKILENLRERGNRVRGIGEPSW